MFSKKKDQVLVLINKKETNTPIHMWFVFYPIDVVWLNSKKEVVFIKRSLRPFKSINPKVKARYVLEFPDNSTEDIKLGSILKF